MKAEKAWCYKCGASKQQTKSTHDDQRSHSQPKSTQDDQHSHSQPPNSNGVALKIVQNAAQAAAQAPKVPAATPPIVDATAPALAQGASRQASPPPEIVDVLDADDLPLAPALAQEDGRHVSYNHKDQQRLAQRSAGPPGFSADGLPRLDRSLQESLVGRDDSWVPKSHSSSSSSIVEFRSNFSSFFHQSAFMMSGRARIMAALAGISLLSTLIGLVVLGVSKDTPTNAPYVSVTLQVDLKSCWQTNVACSVSSIPQSKLQTQAILDGVREAVTAIGEAEKILAVSGIPLQPSKASLSVKVVPAKQRRAFGPSNLYAFRDAVLLTDAAAFTERIQEAAAALGLGNAFNVGVEAVASAVINPPPTGAPTSSPTPTDLSCKSISVSVTDIWCEVNCNAPGTPFCPADMCQCGGPAPAPTPNSHVSCTQSSNSLPIDECYAFQDLYDATNGAQWSKCSGSKLHPCGCSGPVTCSRGHVVGLSLRKIGMKGTLPAALGSMVQLTSLDLSRNALTGSLPLSLTSMKSLTVLDARDNKLTGAVPAMDFKKIKICSLDGPAAGDDDDDDASGGNNVFSCPLPKGAANDCRGSCV